MFTINNAKFSTFAAAAACAVKHAQQRGECKIRARSGALLADFVRNNDGTVSIFATDYGRPLVEASA
jgi:hypothetical protein